MKQIRDYTHYIFDLDVTIMTLNIDWTEWFRVVEKIFAERHIPFTYTSSRAAFAQLNDLAKAEGEATRLEINQKIRDAEIKKVPYMLIIGEKESTESKVSVRKHGQGDLGSFTIPEFAKIIEDEINNALNVK